MGLDLVVGIQWLEQLGTGLCDWKQKKMEFTWGGQVRCLQGVDAPILQSTSLKAITKVIRQQPFGLAVCLNHHPDSTDKVEPEIQRLLNEFSDIFQEPHQLPPAREVEHQIILKAPNP